MNNIIFLGMVGLALLTMSSCKTISKSQSKKEEITFIDPNTYQLYEISDDVKYAYIKSMPVKVGGHQTNEGRLNQRRYLNALEGPNGEKVIYKLLESCCYKKYRNNQGNIVVTYLDQYELKIEGSEQRFIIFMDAFDRDELLAPKGFTFKIKK